MSSKLQRPYFGTVVLCAVQLLFFASLTPAAFGQAVSVAGVTGRVLDPTGAAVANAQVKMVETDTQYSRETNTDASGNYTISNLPVGPYSLEVKAQGFKTYTQPGIVLEVGNNIQVNATLQIG